MTYSRKLYLLLGASGAIGKEIKKSMLLGANNEYLFAQSRLDVAALIENIKVCDIDYSEIIIINATSAFGDELTELTSLLSCLRKKCTQIQFWHISTQAVSNGSLYGETKSRDEDFLIDEYQGNLKILRLGVPVVSVSKYIKGIGYWDKIVINMDSRYKLLIQVNNVDLHYCQHLFSSFIEQSDISVKIPSMRLLLPKRVARLIPYRKLNSILNTINVGLVG